MPSKATLEACLSRYSSSLETKQSSTSRSSNLVELDTWFRSSSLRESMWDKGYALNKDDLVKLMEWKLSRGKWRPSLSGYIASNSASLIPNSTRLSSPHFPLSLASAKRFVEYTCTLLKGVGPATASAILSVYDPTNEPFMSDQAMQHVASRTDDEKSGKGKREYTTKSWERFRGEMQKRKEEEGWETVEELEKALWSFGIEKELGLPKGEDEEDGKVEGGKEKTKIEAKSKKRKSESNDETGEDTTEKPSTKRRTRQSTKGDK
ncbi:hypothetical protein JCM5353_008201 [Sporobolomyces roseus]